MMAGYGFAQQGQRSGGMGGQQDGMMGGQQSDMMHRGTGMRVMMHQISEMMG